MAQAERQPAVLKLLQSLQDLDGLKRLFWQELNYERENKPLSPRSWPEPARAALAEDPVLFASGGEGNAFHVVYCRLASADLRRSFQRLVVNQMLRDHPYALFVFSSRDDRQWQFLNVKYSDDADKRRLFRRITVSQETGLRTAAERLQMLDLATIGPPATSRRGGEDFGPLPDKPAGSLSPLEIQQRHDEAFDVEKVTKDFYRELANWYFWALQHAAFPKDAPKDGGHDHVSVIRLITRLVFCWFIREKRLIPDDLFDERKLTEMLSGFAPGDPRDKQSVFYRAILQNLFFATLNTEMDKREWARDEQNFMAHSLYRYKECFQDPKAALALFAGIPFLNGGLFECLDRDLGQDGGRPGDLASPDAKVSAPATQGRRGPMDRYIRIDGFSRRPDSQPTVPDFLFFGREQEVNLSEEYGDRKFEHVHVRGLVNTLNRYRFTIEENTPFDQEVALDPELCGKVFENLLAAYNPETGTTARKATGSFYTPREIVDYMVDETLVAYLAGKLAAGSQTGGRFPAPATQGRREPDASKPARGENASLPACPAGGQNGAAMFAAPDATQAAVRLRALLAYDDAAPAFNEEETGLLLDAIDSLKALDPAVGSGAFPMGLLHKLVHVLRRLDPGNERWKAKQIAKMDDAVMREEAERIFRDNFDDYGRKLYLIENCLYGVDIQPIAVQIAKMRFFISLVVDQRVNPAAPNLGVRALPNLETKFVAANSLIAAERRERQADLLLEDDAAYQRVRKLRERLTAVRHKHFTARTTATKRKLQDEDRAIREEMAGLLRTAGESAALSRQFAGWDPYDQNTSAGFFDTEWMFGIKGGFDVVIGNPPFVRIQTLPPQEAAFLKEHYATAGKGNFDLYVVFVERGLQLLQPRGQLAFILPHKFFNAQYGAPLRTLLAKGRHLRHVVHFGDQQIFPGATNYVCLLFLARGGAEACRFVRAQNLEQWFATRQGAEGPIPASQVTEKEWTFAVGKGGSLFDKLQRMPVKLGEVADIFVGLQTSADKIFVLQAVGEPQKGIVKVCDQNNREWNIELAAMKRFLQDVSLSSYVEPEANKWLLFPYRIIESHAELIESECLAKEWPGAWAFLKSKASVLRLREKGRFNNESWFAFGRSQSLMLMEKPKLIIQVLSQSGRYTYDAKGFYFTGGGNGPYYGLRWLSSDERRSLHYLQALLNSRLLDFDLHRISTTFRGGYFSYGKQFISKLPIHPIDLTDASERAEHDALVRLVERIMAAKRADPAADTLAWEREIDERVYRLYGLTADEIKIVEGG